MNDVEYLEKQISEVEENLRYIELRKTEYVQGTSIPLQLIKDWDHLQSRLKTLRKQLTDAASAATEDKSVTGSTPKANALKVYVDRDEEIQLFKDMINGKTEIHILLIEAESGMGKTILLDQFSELSKGCRSARVAFKNGSLTLGQILGGMRDQYGQQSFKTFHEECRQLLSGFGGDTTHPALICSKLDAQLNKMAAEERRTYQQIVTDAFLADLETMHQTIDRPIVMFLDVYENASDPTKIWIAEQLIMGIRNYPWLVCVVTGQQTPRIATDGNNWCLQRKLQRLSDEHSREYILKVKYTQNEELVTLITKHAKGRPLDLQQLVLTLLEV